MKLKPQKGRVNMEATAIYCRVSTDHQETEGSSLETQRAACLKYCQDKGHTVTNQFIETYSGQTLDRPQLDELRQLVRSEGVNRVVIYCLDRLSRNATQGVILRDELDKYHVTLESVTEDIDESPLGKAITYLRGTFAEIEAEKIKERTQRGIKNRVLKDGKPVTYRSPFGYKWNQIENRLEPDINYQTLSDIFQWALDGKSYDWIIAELGRRGIPSPNNKTYWNKHTISSILRNPTYAGLYHAFKSVATKPANGNGKSKRIKSSVERLPQDKWHYVPGIEVVNPPISQDQRAQLLEHLKTRQKLSRRNANRDYLLRGRILCMTHKGINGQPRVYHGQPHGNSYRYACPVGGCESPHIDGPQLEQYVKSENLARSLATKTEDFYSILSDKKARNKQETKLKEELATITNENERLINNLAKIEDEWINGEIDEDVYKRLKLKKQVRRRQIKERDKEINDQISILKCEDLILDNWRDIRNKFLKKIWDPESILMPLLVFGESSEHGGWDHYFNLISHFCGEDRAKEIKEMLITSNKQGRWDEVLNYLYETPLIKCDFDGSSSITEADWKELMNEVGLQVRIYPRKYANKSNRRLVKFGKGKRAKEIAIDVQYSIPIKSQVVKKIVLHDSGGVLHNQLYYPIHINPGGTERCKV